MTTDGPAIDVVDERGRPSVRYTDVVVRRKGDPGSASSITSPVLLVEIISPSSTTLDLVVKPAEYMSLASLEAYIVASRDEPRVTVWQRAGTGAAAAGRPFPRLPVELDKRDDAIGIDALALTVPLAEIYRGILEFPV